MDQLMPTVCGNAKKEAGVWHASLRALLFAVVTLLALWLRIAIATLLRLAVLFILLPLLMLWLLVVAIILVLLGLVVTILIVHRYLHFQYSTRSNNACDG